MYTMTQKLNYIIEYFSYNYCKICDEIILDSRCGYCEEVRPKIV